LVPCPNLVLSASTTVCCAGRPATRYQAAREPLPRVPTAFQGSNCVRGGLKRREYQVKAQYQVRANACYNLFYTHALLSRIQPICCEQSMPHIYPDIAGAFLPQLDLIDPWFGPQSLTPRSWVRLPVLSHSHRRVLTLRVEYIFTYSCGATTSIRIAYSAWLTLYMTWIRTYSR